MEIGTQFFVFESMSLLDVGPMANASQTTPPVVPSQMMCMKMITGQGSTNPSIGGSANNCLDRR